MIRILAAILLGNLLVSARASAEQPTGIVDANEEFRDAVIGVVNVANNASAPIELVKATADRAFGEPNAVGIKIHPGLRGWDYMKPAPDSALTIEAALSDARRRLFERGVAVTGPLDGALSTGEYLDGDGRAKFSPHGAMAPNEAGVFFYRDGDPDPGRIMINSNILDMLADSAKESQSDMRDAARTIAWIETEATIVHESSHALAKSWNELHPTKVIDGEVFAFSQERAFLRLIDPHGEGLATLIAVAAQHKRLHPSATAALCYQLASQRGDLWRTDGKPETIKSNVVIPAGYREDKSVL